MATVRLWKCFNGCLFIYIYIYLVAVRVKTSPVTIVNLVPWEPERDITEKLSVMGTPSLQPFLKSYWLTPVQLTGQLSRSMQIWRAPEAVMSESDAERRMAGRAVITAITLMFRSCSQGTEVTIVTGDILLRAFTRHPGETLRYGNAIQSHRERGYGQPVPVYTSEVEHTPFPPITVLVGRAHSW